MYLSSFGPFGDPMLDNVDVSLFFNMSRVPFITIWELHFVQFIFCFGRGWVIVVNGGLHFSKCVG